MELDLMEHVCNSGTGDGEAEKSMQIQGQPLLHNALQASQG